MQKYDPKIRKIINDLTNKAYGLELGIYLDELYAEFQTWKKGEIDSDTLHEAVHEYHKGPSREVYKKFNNSPPDVLLAQAIVQEIIKEDEVPQEVMEQIKDLVTEFKNLL